mmetsp:Transcript_119566/g.338404  ORF Transcript_119566/g.338404 Transcript_119566/m.338404 type:complete len:202 (-) Transcript_119566:1139-1744(-)
MRRAQFHGIRCAGHLDLGCDGSACRLLLKLAAMQAANSNCSDPSDANDDHTRVEIVTCLITFLAPGSHAPRPELGLEVEDGFGGTWRASICSKPVSIAGRPCTCRSMTKPINHVIYSLQHLTKCHDLASITIRLSGAVLPVRMDPPRPRLSVHFRGQDQPEAVVDAGQVAMLCAGSGTLRSSQHLGCPSEFLVSCSHLICL